MTRKSPARTHPPTRPAHATASSVKASSVKAHDMTETLIAKAVADVAASRRVAPSVEPASVTAAQPAAAPKEAPLQMATPATAQTQGNGAFAALLERGMQEILAVTYWFEPPPQAEPASVTVRFVGRRVDGSATPQPADRFIRDETIERVLPGSGPISVTTKIQGINPGEWVVTASIVDAPHATATQQAHKRTPAAHAQPAISEASASSRLVSFWRRWAPIAAPSEASAEHIHTCLLPFARVPGLLPTGSWGAMVGLGVVVALLTQALILARSHVAVGSALIISLAAIAIGAVGAKLWYRIQYRHLNSWNGWCIQGFITGATITVVALLALLRVPADALLDASAPGMLFGMAIGRLGCFFAGCCGGPATTAWWGIWSSDQRVGARRVPAQLMESALALTLGIGALVVDLAHGPVGGGLFIAGLAAYTLGRQGILRLRAEPRKTKWGGIATASVAAVLVLVALVYIGFHV